MTRSSLIVILLSLLITACHRDDTPPTVILGTTTCAACRRAITDESSAAVARSSDGVVKAFDRASCLLKTVPNGRDWHLWFHDHDGPTWIDASQAVFVIQREGAGTPALHTPAFVDRGHANSFYQRTPGRNEIAPDYSTFRAVMSHE